MSKFEGELIVAMVAIKCFMCSIVVAYLYVGRYADIRDKAASETFDKITGAGSIVAFEGTSIFSHVPGTVAIIEAAYKVRKHVGRNTIWPLHSSGFIRCEAKRLVELLPDRSAIDLKIADSVAGMATGVEVRQQCMTDFSNSVMIIMANGNRYSPSVLSHGAIAEYKPKNPCRRWIQRKKTKSMGDASTRARYFSGFLYRPAYSALLHPRADHADFDASSFLESPKPYPIGIQLDSVVLCCVSMKARSPYANLSHMIKNGRSIDTCSSGAYRCRRAIPIHLNSNWKKRSKMNGEFHLLGTIVHRAEGF